MPIYPLWCPVAAFQEDTPGQPRRSLRHRPPLCTGPPAELRWCPGGVHSSGSAMRGRLSGRMPLLLSGTPGWANHAQGWQVTTASLRSPRGQGFVFERETREKVGEEEAGGPSSPHTRWRRQGVQRTGTTAGIAGGCLRPPPWRGTHHLPHRKPRSPLHRWGRPLRCPRRQ